MRRRDFIAGVGAAAWPLGARAQQRAAPAIGYLYSGTPESAVTLVAAFRKGLAEFDFIEGRNLAIEYRYAQDRLDRLPALAADLVRPRVAAIATFGPTAFVAKAATTAIPIVFIIGEDPVENGLVASLNRPGGNITGNSELSGKRLGLVHDLLPEATRFAVLVDPDDQSANSFSRDAKAAASAKGWQVEILAARTSAEIDIAFAALVQMQAHALLVAPSTFFRDRRLQLVFLAVRHAVPAIYVEREFAEAGGLMSYGSSIVDQMRQCGVLVARILKGDKPADLPVMRAVRIDMVLNLITAKVIGISIPPTLLALTDSVIE